MLLSAIGSGCTPSLHDLVADGRLEEARAHLTAQPALVQARNKLGKTPVHYAVTNARPDMLALLAEFGADLNARDVTGMTPLHVAAMLGRKDEALWLLAHGVELEPKDAFGDTPVHTAAIFHGGLIATLRQKGASLTPKNNAGLTPLDAARKYHNDRAAAYLEKQMKKNAP